MKLLFVSTSIPPATDMQTTRNIYLLKALLKQHIDVDILTTNEKGKVDGEFAEVLNNCQVYRTELPSGYLRHQRINEKCRIEPFKKIHNVLANYYLVPDVYMGWNKIGFEYIKNNKLFDYDAIITSSGSYTAHIIGSEWQQFTKNCWIADYGDPWGLDAYGHIVNKKYQEELKILKHCTGLVFTTQATINSYSENYRLNIPFELVQCGYSSLISDSASYKKDFGRCKFLYTGIAYRRARNLGNLIEVIGNYKQKANLTLIGTISDEFKRKSDTLDNVNVKGRVPYNESLQKISESDVLVHIGNFGTLQVPGKTYIYLASEKPILYIKQQKTSDPTEEVLSKFEGVVITENTTEAITVAIEKIINNFEKYKNQSIKRSKSEELSQYNWNKLGDKFASFTLDTIDSFYQRKDK